MTIEKSSAWGVPGTVPSTVRWAGDDRFVLGDLPGEVQPTGGNLWRALGCPAPKVHGEPCMVVPVDAIRCTITREDGSEVVLAVADVVIGWWWGRSGMTVATNTGFLGRRNIAPRAHPNDGEFDVVVVGPSISLRERVVARRRARTGTHLPHPAISVGRARTLEITRVRRQNLRVDGQKMGPWTSIRLQIAPDHMTVLV